LKILFLRARPHEFPRDRVIDGGREEQVVGAHDEDREADREGERTVGIPCLAARLRDRVEADEAGEE